mmetsp:Transcript_26672/g.48896  ORF Transcript_26672/g.48896 Transcript_26672/m.48896 type:complete len:633 (-) Transcript_26672:58-1956(-)
MGCGSSVDAKPSSRVGRAVLNTELKDAKTELLQSGKLLEEHDQELASLRAQQRGLSDELHQSGSRDAIGSRAPAPEEGQHSLASLRSELEDCKLAHESALELERESLRSELKQALDSLSEEHTVELRESIDRQVAEFRQEHGAELEAHTKERDERREEQEEAALAQVQRLRQEADSAEEEIERLTAEFAPLRAAHEATSNELKEAQLELEAELATKPSPAAQAELRAAQQEHSQSEQRFASLKGHLQTQAEDMRAELRLKNTELRQKDEALRLRDVELTEVSQQLVEMQGLFDEVNVQLQSECTRVGKLQDIVQHCAKQGQELESLQGMLEESHKMLGQVREALEHERTERIKATRLLSQEQHRTQLLLDVLKNFKEKLQGLTPQMLLSRLSTELNMPGLLGPEGGAFRHLADHALSDGEGLDSSTRAPPASTGLAHTARALPSSSSLPHLPRMPTAGAPSSCGQTAPQAVQRQTLAEEVAAKFVAPEMSSLATSAPQLGGSSAMSVPSLTSVPSHTMRSSSMSSMGMSSVEVVAQPVECCAQSHGVASRAASSVGSSTALPVAARLQAPESLPNSYTAGPPFHVRRRLDMDEVMPPSDFVSSHVEAAPLPPQFQRGRGGALPPSFALSARQ